MAPPHSEPTSPYNFGLGSDFEIALILPFLYFFSAVFQVTPKTPSLTGTASPDTCSLTPPDELLASLGQRRNAIAQQLLFIIAICFAFRYHEFKRDNSSHFCSRQTSLAARLKHWVYGADLDPVTPRDDYRMTKRREAMRLLFLVVISALLCPVADYLCGRREGASVHWPDALELRLTWVAAVIFVFFRFGAVWAMEVAMVLLGIALQCLFTATATKALALATFGRRYGVVDIWDRRVERWAEAWEKEKRKAEDDEWKILWERFNVQRNMYKAVMDERNKELLVWRKGMREGRGYGPDYWLPREKEDTDHHPYEAEVIQVSKLRG